jgi:signal transduction histidine kinase
MRILVIEDEAILREEVIEWLTLEGYEATGAADGIAGVGAAFHHRPDLIICDVTMPRLDGYGVLLELRANPATADIPFIFLTARASHEDIRVGMDLGADDYVTKPFTRLELLNTVQTRLEKKSVHDAQSQAEIEQWKQAFEQEREQRQFKARLVAMFSHDFRNPLAAILSSISLVRDFGDRMDAERKVNHLNRAEASVRQLMQMLDDMLVASQIEAGKLEFRPEPLNVGEFLLRLVDEFQSIHSETHHLVYENRCFGPGMVDTRLLRQIAANLISNAIKYSIHGGEVGVFLECRDGQAALTVRDQGIGIPEADQADLFKAFQRASNVGRVSGTGLGLSIVRQAVDLHGGTLSLESQVGVGTTVTVTLPVRAANGAG